MGTVVSLDEYRKGNELEEEYLKFLSHVNKFVGIPKTLPECIKAFYFILRYLEGNVNCFSILSVLGFLSYKEVAENKKMLIDYLQKILDDIKAL